MEIIAKVGESQNQNKEVYYVKIAENQVVRVAYSKNINQLYIEEDAFGNMVFNSDECTPANTEIKSEYRAKEIIKFVAEHVNQQKSKMTQFELELFGYKGIFWRKDAEKRLKETEEDIKTGEITIDRNGVARNCIGRVVMRDMMDIIEHVSKDFNRENTEKALDKENQEFLKEYRKQQENYEPSQEELAEMRAAFGEGETVVDVITGKKIKL